jgi:hypothetical protein
MRRLYLLFFFLTPVWLQAQDVTGIWQGHFRSQRSREDTLNERYKFEVQIAQRGKSFEGITYSYLSTFFYGKATATGTVNAHTQKVLLQELKIVEFRNAFGDMCTMTCFLQYSRSGNEEFLEGSYVSMNIHDSSNCGRGTVFLRKVQSSQFYPEDFLVKRQQEIEDSLKMVARTAPPALRAIAKNGAAVKNGAPAKNGTTARSAPPKPTSPSTPLTAAAAKPVHHPANPAPPAVPARSPRPMARATVPGRTMGTESDSTRGDIGRNFQTIVPAVIKDRENEVVKTLVIHTTEVTLNIYDDGAIDNDTVSVYLDNRPVLLHKMLTDRPLVVTLHLDANNDYHEIVMVADNEGTIPPNTSLMIVKAGDKEYEVRITSTEQKNAVIKFQYAK